MKWNFSEAAQKRLINGELNLTKVGPLGMGIRLDNCSSEGATIIVDIEDENGFVLGSFDAVSLHKHNSLHIQDIVQAFKVSFT